METLHGSSGSVAFGVLLAALVAPAACRPASSYDPGFSADDAPPEADPSPQTPSGTPAAVSGADGGVTASANPGIPGRKMTGSDQCGGDIVALAYDTTVKLHVDTSLGSDLYDSPCELDSGPDMVYEVEIPRAGTATFELATENIITGEESFVPAVSDVSVYLRRACESPDSIEWCRNRDAMSGGNAFAAAVDPGSYYLFVDGESRGGGYDLTVTYAAARCGDSAVNPGEACDDGNIVDGDGCNSACALEAGSIDSCAATQAELLMPAGHRVLAGSTTANSDAHGFDPTLCNVADYGGGRDRVMTVVPQVTGTMNLSLGYGQSETLPSICAADSTAAGCWSRVLYVRHATSDASQGACEDVSNQVACDALGVFPSYTQDVAVQVIANETYFVFVDSYWDGDNNPESASGDYNLHVNLQSD